MYFEIVGEITDVEVIAVGSSIRQLMILQAQYGIGKWRKLKGRAWVRTEDGNFIRPRCTGTKPMASDADA